MLELSQIVVGGLLQGCIFGLLAIGFSLVYCVTSAVNLAQGAFAVLAALVTISLAPLFGLPVIPAGLLAVLVTALLAFVIGRVAFLPGLGKLPASTMFILTAGLLIFLDGASLVIWGSQPYTLPTFSGEKPINISGLLVPTQGFWLLGTTAAITASLALILARTRLGRAFRACAENPPAANLVGIGVSGMQLLSFVIAAAIGALGGIVIGPITSFQFNTGEMYTIFGFIAAVIGGLGSPVGAIAGGLCLGIATPLAAAYVSSLFSDALALVLLLAILLWRPSGLFASGAAQRQDVREEVRIHRDVIRLGDRSGTWMALAGAAVLLVLLPWGLRTSGLMSSVIITGIFFLSAIGLDVLMGFGGQISLCQAGFMAIGGYVASVLAVQYGVPPLLGTLAAVVVSLLCAVILASVTMRLRGLYLAIATLAFGQIVATVLEKWDSVTHGFDGMPVPIPSIFGVQIQGATGVYYAALVVLVFSLWVACNILRTPLGRALVAIRDSEISAQSMGINLALYKTISFAVAAFLTGLAGALFAHYVNFLAPDSFDILLSIQFLTIVFVGGIGSLHGVIFGALFVRLLPQAIAIARDYLPSKLAHLPGLEPSVFGLILVLVILFEPAGIYGRWLKTKAYFQAFPMHRRSAFRRQRTYTRSERV
ncbi:MAG: ABC transporter permease [Acetobacteraceae bacterium]